MLGYFEEKLSSSFWDAAEELPDEYIIQREIKKAINGDSFFYNRKSDGKPVQCDGIAMDEFNFYYNLWDDFHFLKLTPQGKGTDAERRWVIDFIKMFEKIHMSVNNFLGDKAQRKMANGRN